MTERQKYLFDLQGYVVVEDVLTPAECDTAIEKIRRRMTPMEKSLNGKDAHGTWFQVKPTDVLLDAGEPFIKLIDHPKIIDLLTQIIGPQLRCESCLSFVRSKSCPPLEIHGGHRGGSANFRYSVNNGRIYTGLSVVAVALQDMTEQDGGFACIPGSHKSDFTVPADDRAELHAIRGPLVRYVAAPKGSAIIFTETLAHGAGTWQRDEPRFGLFYKYNDRAAVYHYQPSRLPGPQTLGMMTEAQRCYFNLAWEAFGPPDRPQNIVPDQQPEQVARAGK